MKNYDIDVLRFLDEAGDRGLKVTKLALHVYNARNTMFCDLSFEQVRSEVRAFVLSASTRREPLLQRVRHGVYRLTPLARKLLQEGRLNGIAGGQQKRSTQTGPGLFDNL